MKRITIVLLAAYVGALACGAGKGPTKDHSAGKDPGQKESHVKPEDIQGCYELGVLNWRPDLRLAEDKEFITPPPRIQILAEHGSLAFEKDGYLVRPAPGFPKSIHRASYWSPKGPNAIEIVWTTGSSGLFMQLNIEADTLRGKATSFWDFPRRKQTSDVVARRVDCIESTYRSVEGTYRNAALGYSVDVPRGLKATTGDQSGPERGLAIALSSGGKIVVFGEPNSLEWKTPLEGVQAELAREDCPSGAREVSPARVGSLKGARGSLVCGDRVVMLFLVFHAGGGPIYSLRLDARKACAANDSTVLQNIAASLKLIPWE